MNKLKLCVTGLVGIVSVSLITLLASGCGNGDSTTDEGLVGAWNLTQMIVMVDPSSDTLDNVSGTLTLNDDNNDSTFTYNLDINDTITIGTFPPIPMDTTISSSGDWSATDDSLTLNDPQVGEQNFLYEINGNTMVTTGTMAISIVNVTIIQTWKKQ